MLATNLRGKHLNTSELGNGVCTKRPMILYTIRIHPEMIRNMDLHISPLLAYFTSQQLWYEEQMVVMHPNKIARLEYGRNTFGKHLICLRIKMNI